MTNDCLDFPLADGIDSMNDDYLPSATLQTLQHRAELLKAVRMFFERRGYWEVETPLMSQESVVDANLDPFVVEGRYFLQTSPELGMKRLLTAGAESIYQITRAFRRSEHGSLHNPEFTMVEWYRTGDTHVEQMEFVEQLVRELLTKSGIAAAVQLTETPLTRRTFDETFEDVIGTRVLDKDAGHLQQLARDQKLAVPETLSPGDRDGWLNLLWAESVQPRLGRERPEFVYNYPASQAALAKLNPEDPQTAERFELFMRGLEICNGYHELTDVDELRRRIVVESRKRTAQGLPQLPEPTSVNSGNALRSALFCWCRIGF